MEISPKQDYKVGDLVMLRDFKSKTKPRETFIIEKLADDNESEHLLIRKLNQSLRPKLYKILPDELIPTETKVMHSPRPQRKSKHDANVKIKACVNVINPKKCNASLNMVGLKVTKSPKTMWSRFPTWNTPMGPSLFNNLAKTGVLPLPRLIQTALHLFKSKILPIHPPWKRNLFGTQPRSNTVWQVLPYLTPGHHLPLSHKLPRRQYLQFSHWIVMLLSLNHL